MVSLDLRANRYHGGLEYLTVTPKDAIGPPILIFHGFTQSAWSMLRLASEIASRSAHRCLVLNLPGHQDLVELPPPREYFALLGTHFPHAHLLGYSMGGRLAAWYGTTFPDHVRSMTLISTNLGIASPEERRQRAVADDALAQEIVEGGSEGYPGFLSRWDSQPLFLGRRVSMQAQRIRASRSPEGVAGALRTYSTGLQPELSESLLSQDYPLTVIVGAEDTKYVAIAQHVRQHGDPRRTLVAVIDHVGHDVPSARPDLVVDIVVAGLRDTSGSS
ncbi:MAG: alpha/beta fold hydrolase [Acidimicrobiales bacterium]